MTGAESDRPARDELLQDAPATIADLKALVRFGEQEWRRAREDAEDLRRRARDVGDRATDDEHTGVAMKSDTEIREDVLRELGWDPQVTDPDSIGVAVKDGAVTLTGHTSTYAEKLAAVRAAARVYGVKAVADELKVRLAGEPRDDSDVARAIAHVLESNTQIPEGEVGARVQSGWVTLDGEVDHAYQRREVERMVRNIRGVLGITNSILVTPPVSPDEVQAEIEEAFKREAAVDARHIRVEVTDHTATLYGHVHSLHEAAAAAAAAAAAPGVAKVDSRLVVSPLGAGRCRP